MKKAKKIFIAGAVALLLGTTSLTVFAKTQYNTPAEVVAGITGRTVESVVEERKLENKTYGTIALEADVLDEFKAEALEMKKANLTKQVAEGKITQDEALEIIKVIEENQLTCDGTCSGQMSQNKRARFGSNNEGFNHGGKNEGHFFGGGHGQNGGNGFKRNQSNKRSRGQ